MRKKKKTEISHSKKSIRKKCIDRMKEVMNERY